MRFELIRFIVTYNLSHYCAMRPFQSKQYYLEKKKSNCSSRLQLIFLRCYVQSKQCATFFRDFARSRVMNHRSKVQFVEKKNRLNDLNTTHVYVFEKTLFVVVIRRDNFVRSIGLYKCKSKTSFRRIRSYI